MFRILGDYISFVFSGQLVGHSLIQLVIGWIPVMAYLIRKGYASFADDQLSYDNPFTIRCADKRWFKDLVVLGGPAALAFGLSSRCIALWAESRGYTLMADWFNANARLRFVLSCVNLVYLTVRIYQRREDIAKHSGWYILFESHIFGCGHLTGAGAFWPLFWMQEFAKHFKQQTAIKVLTVIRDLDTVISFVFSLPMMLVVSVTTLVTARKVTVFWMVTEPG